MHLLVLGTGGLVGLYVMARLMRRLLSAWFVEPYKAPLFWVDYRSGFVRRGFPGEVLSWFGRPTLATMTTTAVLIAALAAAGWVVLARELAHRSEHSSTVLVLILASPFGLPLVVRDVGRYDALAVAAFVVVAAVVRHCPGRPMLVIGVATVGFAVATACEEFVVLYAVPLALTAATRLDPGRRRSTLTVSGLMLAPSLAIALAGLLVPPNRTMLASSVAMAREAGVQPSDQPGTDAATLLGASAERQFGIFTEYQPAWLVVLLAGGAALAISTGWSVWALLGRPRPSLAKATALWVAGSAAALSLVGVDFLRWWGLALFAFLVCLAAHPSTALPGRALPKWLLVALCVATVVWQLAPIGPPPR